MLDATMLTQSKSALRTQYIKCHCKKLVAWVAWHSGFLRL
jgi:hypothetical protein